jgi:hypothetical protein
LLSIDDRVVSSIDVVVGERRCLVGVWGVEPKLGPPSSTRNANTTHGGSRKFSKDVHLQQTCLRTSMMNGKR